jgi:site-specific DNA recombinase
MIAAVISTRLSPRPNAAECESCDRQEERCLAYCNAKDYKVLPASEESLSHRDEDVSGGVFERPGLAAAIEALAALDGEKVLVVDSMSRLGRDMLVILTIRHEVERAGARIEFADGTPVGTTPEGELFGHILAAFATYERARVRHATSRGLKRRQKNGEWFGRPRVGWMRDPNDSKKLVPHPGEQQAIGRAVRLSQLGHPSQRIAELLTEEFGPFRGVALVSPDCAEDHCEARAPGRIAGRPPGGIGFRLWFRLRVRLTVQADLRGRPPTTPLVSRVFPPRHFQRLVGRCQFASTAGSTTANCRDASNHPRNRRPDRQWKCETLS